LESIKFIETYSGRPLDEIGSFHLYIGRNIPDRDNEGEVLREITTEELNNFFKSCTKVVDNNTIPLFQGYTRIPCYGFWDGETENSEQVIIFRVPLRDILSFCFAYMKEFDQNAVYVEIINSTQFLIEREVKL
jgi:RNA recognition motif-containing protein